MMLDVYVLEHRYQVEITPETLQQGENMYAKMDQDMDRGWKIGPEFIEHPDRVNRAQVAADRLLSALETGNQNMIKAMGGYIASRLPEVRSIHVDTNGEPLNTSLQDEQGAEISP